MDNLITLHKLQDLVNLVHTNNQILTQDSNEQLEWLFNSANLKINLDNLEIPVYLVVNRVCILYFVNIKKTSHELHISYFNQNTDNSIIIDGLVKLEKWVNSNKTQNTQTFQAFIPEICSLFTKKNAVSTHFGVPFPDSLTGRPKISDKICKFECCTFNQGCSEKPINKLHEKQIIFKKKIDERNARQALVDHLKNHTCYVAGMHTAHEEVISKLNLTSKKIIAEGMTSCPSPICNHSVFKTPDKLILHLTALGIPPFWNSSIGIKATLDYHNYLRTFHLNKTIFNLPENFKCPSCCDINMNFIVTLNYPCFHLNICFNCIKKSDSLSNRCNMCNENIHSIYPLSSCI
jgi:hypothetical protein